MSGLSAHSFAPLSGLDHVRQSVETILNTRVGSRVMRRDFGSRLYELVDAPLNRATVLDIYAATAEAIARWEPRLELLQVDATSVRPGSITLDLVARYLPDGRDITLDGIVVT